MKRFFIIFTYILLSVIIIYLFDSIISGKYCHCHYKKVFHESTLEERLNPVLT